MSQDQMNNTIVDNIYNHFKSNKREAYDEEKHCKMLIKVMLDPKKGTLNAFCLEAKITEQTFYNWVNRYDLLRDVYSYSRLIAREQWEEEGRELRDREFQVGTINYAFEHWKLVGWSRFGVSKNSRLKLKLDAGDTPAKHYEGIIRQASEGDFTASEFKQLMEAVNVGLNVQQVYELQKQIDELKSDLELMAVNKNVQNNFTNQGIAQKD